jgi:diguanylate cyclase (GGDEF)-like protein
MAWREADRRALESEQLQLTNALENLNRELARDQITMAQWDETFSALQDPIDRRFIEEVLISDLWDDFGFDRTFIIGTDGKLIALGLGNAVHFETKNLAPDDLVRRLADQARAAFNKRQNASSSVYAEWYVPRSALLDLATSTYAVIDGSPALLSAIPILPGDGDVRFSSDYPVILVNAVFANEAWLAKFHERLDYRDLDFVHGAPERMDTRNHILRAADGSIFGYFTWDHSKPGREIWLAALPLIFLLASIIAVVAFAAASRIGRLTTTLEESERKNRHFARHDALTGLPNRHHFTDCLNFALDGLPDRGFAIFACDLDRFKPINDTYGHEAGDMVLCTVADRMSREVGKKGVVSRIGGDEFIILLTQSTDGQELGSLAGQILTTLARPIDIGNGLSVDIGISIGIACAPDCGTNEKDLIRMADMALYRAKENGRNCYAFADQPPLEVAHAG